MKKVLAIIVTYNPCFDDLISNISIISDQVDKCYIIDNGSENARNLHLFKSLHNNVEVVLNNENKGLGFSYNKILNIESENFKYFATFDQDTLIPKDALSDLVNILEQNERIGVVGPIFTHKKFDGTSDKTVVFKDVIIQSCAVFRSDLFKKIGGFNEQYFIDSVDFEYCLRILLSNKKVALYKGVVIQHQLGVRKNFLGISYYTHSAFRNYHISRNHILLSREFYKSFPMLVLKKNIFFILHLLKLFLLDHDVEKIRKAILGIKHGFMKDLKF